MPHPVSIRSNATPTRVMRVRATNSPPCGIASNAFLTRFSNAACKVCGSRLMLGRSGSKYVRMVTLCWFASGSKKVSTCCTCSFNEPGTSSSLVSFVKLKKSLSIVWRRSHCRLTVSILINAWRASGDEIASKSSCKSSMFMRITDNGFLISCARDLANVAMSSYCFRRESSCEDSVTL